MTSFLTEQLRSIQEKQVLMGERQDFDFQIPFEMFFRKSIKHEQAACVQMLLVPILREHKDKLKIAEDTCDGFIIKKERKPSIFQD